ncbi:MAG: helix-turn-helix domain-containing protein [Patescibacteria group bacterium]
MEEDKMNRNLYTSLKQLGLSDQETNLYLLSLKYGPSPIVTLARYLDISRPNVYKLIKELELKGLVKSDNKEKFARNFVVEPPTAVLQKLREKQSELENLNKNLVLDLPELLAGYHQGDNETKVKIYKGREQYLNIFDKSIEEEDKEIQFYGSSKDFIKFVSWDNELSWIKRRVSKDIFIKVLTFKDEISSELKQDDKDEKRETRIIKSVGTFESSFMLFANKVVFWQPKAPLAILVEDQYITKMMKSIFESEWERSK